MSPLPPEHESLPNTIDAPASTARHAGETPVDGASPAGPDAATSSPTGDAMATGPFVPAPEGGLDGGTAGPGEPRYQTRGLHRTGGLGAVWLARDTLLGRDVALKSIRPGRAVTPEQVARFVHEARVTSQLEHPGIVPLYDLVPAETGSVGGGPDAPPGGACYVMRFVTGQTLTEAAVAYHRKRAAGDATRLELTALLESFVAVCRAVAYAHSRGVLHRDLKGLNVVLGGFGEVFLLDWGLAKFDTGTAADAPDGADAGPGLAEARAGTPAFMAPEVAAGRPATKQSDVYGLGAVLYEILAGRPPYAGRIAQVLEQVAAGAPPSVRPANPSAPRALEAVCRKAMARDPADRYPAAEEVATEVRRWLADEPVAAHREPFPARAARWARRHRTPAVAAAVLLFTATVASLIATGLVWREQRHTRAEQVNTAKNADAAIDVVRKLSTYVEAYEMSGGSGAATERERKDRLEPALASYERVLDLHPDDPVLRWNVARMHRMRANLSRFLEKYDDAEQSYTEAIRLFGQLAADFPEELKYQETRALTQRDFGLLLQRLGRRQQAARLVDDSISLFEDLRRRAPEERNYNRILAMMLMARSDWELQEGRLVESEGSARRSMDLFAGLATLPGGGADPLDPLLHAMAEHNLAMTLREVGRLDEALFVHDLAVERITGLTKKLPNNRNARSFLYRARTERAWTLGRTPGNAPAAIADLESAVQGWDNLIKQSGETPTDAQRKGVAGYYCGRLKARAGQPAAAAKDLAAAAKIQEALFKKQPQVSDYQFDLGRTYTALGGLAGKSPTAAEWYRKAREMLDGAVRQYPENVQYRQARAELDTPTSPKR